MTELLLVLDKAGYILKELKAIKTPYWSQEKMWEGKRQRKNCHVLTITPSLQASSVLEED